MPFSDRHVAKALEIFVTRNELLQQELASLSRHPGSLFIEEKRIQHAQNAFLRAADERGTNPYDFSLCIIARSPAELERMREERRQELRVDAKAANDEVASIR